MQFNDDVFTQLGNLGYTGTYNDRFYSYLGSLGYTGTLQDRMMSWFGALGYTGGFADRWFQWAVSGFTISSLSVSAGSSEYTIDGPLSAFTVTIASGPFAGTYPTVGTYDEADFLGAAPLILADPIRTGTLGVGNLQTANLAPVLYDSSAGPLVQTASWEKLGVEVSDELTYTQQSGDDSVSVQFTQTAVTGYGTDDRTIDAIPIPAYTPAGVLMTKTPSVRISRTGGYAASNGDTALVHICLRLNAFIGGAIPLIVDPNGLRVLFVSSTQLTVRWDNPVPASIGTSTLTPASAFVANDTINILSTLDVRAALGTNLGRLRGLLKVNGGTPVTTSASNLSTANLINQTGTLTSNVQFSEGNYNIYRLALWAGITVPDILDSGVQSVFFDASTGAPKSIDTAVALIGADPTVRLPENATDANALLNPGSLSDFTSKAGTFIDAAF